MPPGWTTNPSGHTLEEEWTGRQSEGQTIARCHGLGPATPIMEDAESWTVMFQSGDKFYLWNRIDDIVEVIFSQDLDEIVAEMVRRGGLGGLQKEVIPFLFDPSELGDDGDGS